MIDIIHTNKDIPREVIFRALEEALAAGVRKRLGVGEELDRATSTARRREVTMEDEEGESTSSTSSELGRIAAQAVKQGFMQRVREAERDVLFDEYETRVGYPRQRRRPTLRGQRSRQSTSARSKSHLTKRRPRVRGETYAAGDRIRAIVVEVRKDGSSRVKILV